MSNDDLEAAVQLVLGAGLSTGHANSCKELVAEVLEQTFNDELADLREAAFAVERFALPYWEGGGDPKSIPVSNEAMRELQAALYPEESP